MVINFKSNIINILFYSFFILTILNGTIFIFDELYLLYQLFFLAILIFFYILSLNFKEIANIKTYSLKIEKFKFDNLIYSFIILSPLSIFFIFNFFEENSYAGDTIIHIENSIEYNYFWINSVFSSTNEKINITLYKLLTSKILFIFLLFSLLVYFRKYISSTFKIIIIIFLLIISSYLYEPRITYPTGLYSISLPFNTLNFLLNYSLVGGLRLANFASIFIWLFFLRPIFVGKWPDYKIVFFSLIIFTNNQYLFLFTSSYLEAYSLIFLLLALEVLLDKKNYHIEKAIVLIAFASAFKQPVIFLIPFIFILKQPWNLTYDKLIYFFLFTLVFILPFATYYYYSIELANWPRFTDINISNLNTENINFYFNKLYNRYGLYNFLIITIFIIYFILMFHKSKKQYYFIIIMISALLLSLYLFLDINSSPWIGYIRFNAYSEFIILFLLMYNTFLFQKKNYNYFFLILFLVSLSIINYKNYYDFTFGEDSNRNYIIHEYEPIYLPIKSLIKENLELGNFSISEKIYINIPNESLFYDTTILNNNSENKLFFYSDYKNCGCNKDNPNVITTFLNQINQNNEQTMYVFENYPYLNGYHSLFNHLEDKNLCIKKMKITCKNIIQKIDYKNNIIGISGIYESN